MCLHPMNQFTREEHQQYYNYLVKMSRRASEILKIVKKEYPEYFDNIEKVEYDSVQSYMMMEEFRIDFEDDYNVRYLYVPFNIFFGESPIEDWLQELKKHY